MKNLVKILILSILSFQGLAQSKMDMKANNITINRPMVIEHNSTTAMEIKSPLNFSSEFFFFEGNNFSGAMRRSGGALQFDFNDNVFFDVGSPSRRTSIQSTGVVTDGSFVSKNLGYTTTNTAQIKPVFADKDGKLVVDNIATNHYQSYNFTAVQAQDYDDQLRKGSGFAWFNTTNAPKTMYLPVNLPDGVKVTNVRMFVNDNSASNISFAFNKNSHLSNAFTTVASGQSSVSVASIFSINDNANEVIDNFNNSYYVNISSVGNWTSNTLQFHSLVISYQYQ